MDSCSGKSRFISFLLAAALVGFLSAATLVSVAYAEEGVTPEAETTNEPTVCEPEPDPEPADPVSPSETSPDPESEPTEPESPQPDTTADCEPPTVAEEPIEEPAVAEGVEPMDSAWVESGGSEESGTPLDKADDSASSADGDPPPDDSSQLASTEAGIDETAAEAAVEDSSAENSEPDGGSVEAAAADEPQSAVSDPYFVRGGDTYTFLPSAGDCGAAPDPSRCLTSATPIQAALDDIAAFGAPDDRLVSVDGGSYNGGLIVDGGLFPFLNNLRLAASGNGGTPVLEGAILLKSLSRFDLHGLKLIDAIMVQDSSNVNIIGTDGNDSLQVELVGAVYSLTVDAAVGDDIVTIDTNSVAGTSVVDVSDSGVGGADSLTVVGTSGDDTFEVASGQVQVTTPVSVTMTYAGVEDLTVDGGAGSDTLAGPDTDSVWEITGTNLGTLKDMETDDVLVDFVSIENLIGGDDNQDVFIFYPEGQLAGTIDAGAGGYDSFIYLTAAADRVIIVPDAGGTAVHNGSTIFGLEPLVQGANPDEVVIWGTDFDDSFVLEDDEAQIAGWMQLRCENCAFEFPAAGLLMVFPFLAPIQLISVRLGRGKDKFSLGSTDPALSALLSIDGGPGDDLLVGSDVANSWAITAPNGGSLNGWIDFRDVENLEGRSQIDSFTLRVGGRLSGGIDGGDGDDELAGPDDDTDWHVTGPNAGNIPGLAFTRIENLTGAADNQDTFVFHAAGTLSGVVDGGDGGFDTVALDGGVFDTVTFVATGFDSGTISRDADVITYAGMEPAIAPTITAANVEITFDDVVQTISIQDDGNLTNGLIEVTSTGSENVGPFPVPTTSLIVHGGSQSDTIIINQLDNDFDLHDPTVTVTGGGGVDSITVNAITGTGTWTINGETGSDTITINSIGDKSISLNGGADSDTYEFNNSTDQLGSLANPVTISDSGGSNDKLDFTNYTGTIASTNTSIIGSDGSKINFPSGAIEEIIHDGKLDITTATSEFLDGLQDLVDWANALSSFDKLGLPLPVIAGNVEVSVGEALEIAEAINQLRLKIKNHLDPLLDSGTVTTGDLLAAVGGVSGFVEAGIEHLDRAIIGDAITPALTGLENYGFEIKINGGTPILVNPTADANLNTLIDNINAAIAAQPDLLGKAQAVLTEGRVAIQSTDPEFTQLDVKGLNDAVAVLGFVNDFQAVVLGALENLGDLDVQVLSGVTLDVIIGASSFPELDLHLVYEANRTNSFNIDLGENAGSEGIQFDAGASLNIHSEFSADLDLRLRLDGSPDFLLDINSLHVGADVNGAVAANLFVGFLGASATGTIDLEADLDVTFGGGTGITVAQLQSLDIGSLTPIITPTPTSDLTLDLDVSVTNTFGFTPPGTPHININVSDLFTGDRDVNIAFTNFAELFDFDNMNAAGFAGLLIQLAGWFDGMGDSRFSDMEIPFTNQTVADILDFKDLIGDTILFDDGDSSIAAKNKLVSDLNQALVAAGVSDIYAQGDGITLELVAKDPATSFSVTASVNTWLGFVGTQGSSGGSLTAFSSATLPDLMADPPETPGNAVLEVTIGTADPVTVTVEEAKLLDNVAVGFDIPKLLFGDSSPTFLTAQELASRLSSVLGLPLPLSYDAFDKTLSFSIDLSATLFDATVPINFNLDLSPIANLSSNAELTLNASGRLTLTMGVDLEDPAPSTLITPITLLISLNGGDGVDIKVGESYMGSADVRETNFRLSGDATFVLDIDGFGGPETVTVTKASTLTNNSVADLIADIDIAISDALSGIFITAAEVVVDGTPFIKLTGGADEFSLAADPSNPASRELGFGVDQASSNGGTETLTAENGLRDSIGRFGTDISFAVDIDGGGDTPVTVTAEDTDGTIGIDASTNNTVIDLVLDINRALRNAGLQSQIDGEIDPTSDLIADFIGNMLLFTGGPSVTTFSITAAGPAVTELGLDNGARASDSNDFVILTHSGSTDYYIDLDAATDLDVGDVIQEIALQTGGTGTINDTPSDPNVVEGLAFGDIEIAYNADRTGLTLIDSTSGANPFTVMPVNGSLAALDLRIVGVEGAFQKNSFGVLEHTDLDGDGDIDADDDFGIIKGGSIAGVSLTDRFYVENAVVRGDITLGGTIVASAVFGDFVTIALNGTGTLTAGVRMGLKNPDTGVLGDRVTLAELIRGLGDIRTIVETPNLSGGGSLTLDVSLDPFTSIISLGGTPQVTISLGDFGNPFVPSIVTPQITDFSLSSGSFDITLISDNLAINGTVVTVDLSGLTGYADLEALAQALDAAIHNAFIADAGLMALFPSGVPDFVSTTAVASDVLLDPEKLVLNALDEHGITGYSISNATAGAAAILGFPLAAAPDLIGDLLPDTDFNFSDLDDLLKFETPEFNFGSIIDALVRLSDFVGQFEEFGFLNENLPLIDMSVNDVLDFADRLDTAIDEALANPAGAIQELEARLEEALGLPSTAIQLSLETWDNETPSDASDDIDLLRIDIHLETSFTESVNLAIPSIDLSGVAGIGGFLDDAVDFGGSANLSVSGSLDLFLDVGIDLADPTNIYLYNSTELTGTLTASAADLEFRAALGPFGLFVKGGTATISGTISAGLDLDQDGNVDSGSGSPDRILITDLLGDLTNNLAVDITGDLVVDLPTYFPTEFNSIGSFIINVTSADWDDPSFDIADPSNLTLPNFELADFGAIGLFDSILLAADGLDLVLETLQDVLDGEIFGLEIPFIGDQLAAGAGFIQDFRDDFVAPFREFLESADEFIRNFTDPSANIVSSLLFDLLASPALTGLAFSLGILKPLPSDPSNPDNPDTPGAPDGPEDFIKLDTDGSEFIQWNFSIGDTAGVGTEIDMDLGIPGLGIETEGSIGLAFEWDMDVGFGLSLDDGFYLDVSDENELFVNVDVTLPSSIVGRLAFLQLSATDAEVYSTHDGMSNVGLAFEVDISNGSDPSDERLGLSELGRISFEFGVAAEAVAELQLELKINEALIGSAAAGFPKIQSDFILDWGIGTYNVSDPESSVFVPLALIGDSIQDGLKLVAFRNVSLDVGSFLGDVLGPIVIEVKKITEPIQPIIDVITTPIPVLSDLGPPVTLLDIAASFGTVDAGMIRSIADIISLVNRIPDPSAMGALLINFGDFTVFSTADGILSDLSNPGLQTSGSGGLFDQLKSNPSSLVQAFDNNIGGFTSALSGSSGDASSKSAMTDLLSGNAGSGFDFPILNDPSQVFGILMGNPATLVTYDMEPLVFEFEWSTFFSIFGPLGVSINIEFSAAFDFAFGYDTLGIQEFVKSDFQNPELLFDGFFISDTDQADGSFGVDVDEIVLAGALYAAAELNLGVARAGVAGGIFAVIEFDLFDPNRDGKIRISEIIMNIENQLKAPGAEKLLAPLAPFDVHGEITAKLFAFLKIDLFFFKIDKTFDITPEITLLEFDIDFFRPPVLANELDNGDLVLNMGRFAEDRMLGDTTDGPEHFIVQGSTPGNVQVKALGLGPDAEVFQDYSVSGKIIAYGDEGNDIIDLSLVTGSVAYQLEGGVGIDQITLNSAATGNANILGGDGDDIITSGAGNDIILGGRGEDTIDSGGGNDIVFGDDGEITSDNAAALLKFDDADDDIVGGTGVDFLIGGGGDDNIDGGDGDDIILGDNGRIVLSTKVVSDTNRGTVFGDDTLFGGADTDWIYGGKGNDIIDGGAGTDIAYGEDGSDTVYGGGDSDELYGQRGDDVIFGLRDPAAPGGTFDATDATSDAADTISGNQGDDTIHGNDGADWIFGNGGADEILGDAGDDHIFGGIGPDLIYGGEDADTIDGGAGSDIIFGDNAADLSGTGTPGSPYNATVYGMNIPSNYLISTTSSSNPADPNVIGDTIFAGIGSDFIDGQAGNDTYLILLQGADNASFINVYDSGVSTTDTDFVEVTGTVFADRFLLRASSSISGLAFVALINEDDDAIETNDPVERINYWNLERMSITGSFGDDYFAVDDVRAETTITGDVGEDRFQIGQLYRSPRDAGAFDFNHVETEDVFATIETTVGWLSNGISRPMTIYGGTENDRFTVFHNKAVLSLFGEDGDDTFLIKAFALAGSQEPQRERTDISGGAGADLVQYAMNAPVNIDGGDGFDTVIVIGTEFGDDFVIRRDGVYGAGLNVNFVNIESLSVDGAEGDDRFFVMSTSEKFVTQVFGGLGSDTFNMSGDTPPIISNDLRGHSGVITHEIENVGTSYDETIIAGISANVADNDKADPTVVISEADGSTVIIEGGPFDEDSYLIVLSKPPAAGKEVVVQVLAPIQTQDQRERGSKLLRLESPTETSHTPDRTTISLTFTEGDWYVPQIVFVGAPDDADPDLDYDDDAQEGPATGFINHIVTSPIGIISSPTTPPVLLPPALDGTKETLFTDTSVDFLDPATTVSEGYMLLITDNAGAGQSLRIKSVVNANELILFGEFRPDYFPDTGSIYTINQDIDAVRAVTALVYDNDRAGVLVREDDNSTELFEAGATDTISVVLTRQPTDQVTVDLASNDSQLTFSDTLLTFSDNPVDANAWNIPQVVTVTGFDDAFREGFHHGLISFAASSVGDTDEDVATTEPITLTVSQAHVGLKNRPKNGVVSEVRVGGVPRDANLYEVISNKVVFLKVAGGTEFEHLAAGTAVEVDYTFVNPGYDGLEVKPVLTNIADDEVPQVKITESGGTTDVIEFDPGLIDTFLQSQTQINNVFFPNVLNFNFDVTGLDPTGGGTLSVFAVADLDLFFEFLELNAEGVLVQNLFVVGGAQQSLVAKSIDLVQADLETLAVDDTISFVVTPSLFVGNLGSNELTLQILFPADISDAVAENLADAAGFPKDDSYELVLTKEPTADVQIRVTPEITKTSAGKIVHFGKQVTVSSSHPDAIDNGDGTITLTFAPSNWDVPQTVEVSAVDDDVYDGDDTQVFAPELHTVSKIQGPLYLHGAGGQGSILAFEPLMLPYELNVLPPTDDVQNVNPDGTTMTVPTGTLLDGAVAINSNIVTVEDLVFEMMTVTIADGVEEIGQFRQIVEAVDNFDGSVTLTLNEAWDLSGGEVMEAFSEITKYAITRMSPNFFAVEEEQIDYLFVYNGDSPADNTISSRAGLLTDSTTNGFEGNQIVESFVTQLDGKWLTGLGMGSEDLKIGPFFHPRGITYGDMEVVEINLGDGIDHLTVDDTHIRSDGFQTWTIINTGDEHVGTDGDHVVVSLNSDAKALHSGVVTSADANTLSDAVAAFPQTTAGNDLAGYLVEITGGSGLGQRRIIASHTGTALTVSKPWNVTPDTTSFYSIVSAEIATGQTTTSLADATDILVDTGASFDVSMVGKVLEIIEGPGAGFKKEIIEFLSGNQLRVSSDWAFDETPTELSHYRIQGDQDGPVAINAQVGEDVVDASASSIALVIFGGEGADTITGGSGDDIIFGDRGRVDYRNEDFDGEGNPKIVTLLGLVREKIDPEFVTGETASALTDATAAFPVETIDAPGLIGLMVSITDGTGFRQEPRLITDNTSDTLTVSPVWDTPLNPDPGGIFDPSDPDSNPSKYRISLIPEDQTDAVVRDPSLIIAIDETVGGDDTIIGNGGNDRIFGGLGDDDISGDGGEDIVFGDHGRLDYLSNDTVGGEDGPAQGDFVPATLERVRSTFDNIGGADTVDSGDGNDIILGGFNPAGGGNSEDVLLGGSEDDIILGDNGLLGLSPDGSTLDDPRDALLDKVETIAHAVGGVDIISGNADADIIMGGTAGETLYGDDVAGSSGSADGDDILIGDNGEVIYVGGIIAEIRTTDTTEATGGADSITGNFGNDVILGGVNGSSDVIVGSGSADILLGDNGAFLYNLDSDLSTLDRVETTDLSLGGGDIIYGNDGDDVLIGGTGDDIIDGGTEADLIFGDNVRLTNDPGSGAAVAPRFRALIGTVIYDTDDNAQVDGTPQPNPDGMPAWADWQIFIDLAAGFNFNGNDYIAGGADDDTIFGQLGDDVIQGDGSIASKIAGTPVAAMRETTDGTLTVMPSFEDAADGDDYIEGNGGQDVIFGNLGQDDIVGGSSNLFSLDTPALRPDTSDLIFGGAGGDDIGDGVDEIIRNNLGDTSGEGHARDADVIAGDNANIYRLVGTNGTDSGAYLSFSYDNYDSLKIIPRAVELLDYTLGGPDFNSAGAADDIGDADEIHGESGDDVIYGMVGGDVLFGEGQDDDLIGGYGFDWISGGTGQDGILGDDGRIYTSRNSTAFGEPLYGIAALPAVDVEISTPGNIQQATINVSGELKKTVNLTPFNVDPSAGAQDPLFDPGSADDILYGGLGGDFVHGGPGDDAISGAEALPEYYDAPENAGDVLRYGQERAGEFAAYDEFDPWRKILVDENGVFIVDGSGSEFLLNFEVSEGPDDPHSAGTGFDPTPTDGDDRLFGDLGNDWVVGGTGQDHMYGGWGDDLLNADDDHDSTFGSGDDRANNIPDTHPSYEDIAYGGAGRDVLIANTGGDRLIDWAGEFNSYIVPFAPFGVATISRSLQPQLFDYLYDLSESDGADPTRAADTGAVPARNGEPEGELGLVTQKDFAWHDQTGAPDDPQPGNIAGGRRDVLRSANFNDGQAQGFVPDSGTWTVSGGRYYVAPTALGGDAVSVFYVDHLLPIYFEMQATINADKPTGGSKANTYLIFDYQGPDDFKFAGINVSINKLQMGIRDADGWQVVDQSNAKLKPNTDYNMLLALNGTTATLVVDNKDVFAHAFAPRVDPDGFSYGLNAGMVGIGANNSSGLIDNVAVQILPPEITLEETEDFKDGFADRFSDEIVGAWAISGQRYEGSPGLPENAALSLSQLPIGANSLLELDAKLQTGAVGGVAFDSYSPNDYKFAAISPATDQVLVGHYTDRHGWTIDAAASKTLQPNKDHNLTVTLKGLTVSVYVNGQAVLGYVYNGVVVDGAFGLLAREGTSSFDAVTIRTDDPAYAPPVEGEPLLATYALLEEHDLNAIIDEETLNRAAREATGLWLHRELDQERLARLATATFQLADLRGLQLGLTVGNTVLIDSTAAGRGWFIDPRSEPISGQVDLLTVLTHEIGHALGWDHEVGAGLGGYFMGEMLSPGVRLLPGTQQRDVVATDQALKPIPIVGHVLPAQLVTNAAAAPAAQGVSSNTTRANVEEHQEDEIAGNAIGVLPFRPAGMSRAGRILTASEAVDLPKFDRSGPEGAQMQVPTSHALLSDSPLGVSAIGLTDTPENSPQDAKVPAGIIGALVLTFALGAISVGRSFSHRTGSHPAQSRGRNRL